MTCRYLTGEKCNSNGILKSTKDWNIYDHLDGTYSFDIICCGNWRDYKNLTLDKLKEYLEYWNIQLSVLDSDQWATID